MGDGAREIKLFHPRSEEGPSRMQPKISTSMMITTIRRIRRPRRRE